MNVYSVQCGKNYGEHTEGRRIVAETFEEAVALFCALGHSRDKHQRDYEEIQVRNLGEALLSDKLSYDESGE